MVTLVLYPFEQGERRCGFIHTWCIGLGAALRGRSIAWSLARGEDDVVMTERIVPTV